MDMDHAATVSVQFRAVSQADELRETPSAALTLVEGMPDEVLLAHVARGIHEALAVLFRRYARCIRNIGLRILRDAGEADDLVQEVFLYVFRKGSLYDPSKGSGRSWVIQVAYTQAYLRRRALQSHGFYAPAGTERAAETDPSLFQVVEHDYTVEGFFGRNGWKNVWDSLTECQRETLRLHFYEGCTFTEIAEKLGQSYVNIRHHYYRGLEKLRKHADENDLNWP
jgi:RNA polymerase sigma-70 factor (ECF subfamily)